MLSELYINFLFFMCAASVVLDWRLVVRHHVQGVNSFCTNVLDYEISFIYVQVG